MTLSSALLDEAVDQLATLPGIGRRTAMRLALDLMRRDTPEVVRFSEAIRRMREELRRCSVCCNISDGPLCAICADPRRDGTVICVVEDIRDVIAIEQTRQYRGKYHVLGGVISPMDNIGPEDLTADELVQRLATTPVGEVVLALRATVEGDTTAFYVARRIAAHPVAISTIARGISVGGDLDQADEVTLGRSIADRKPYAMAGQR
ncbi:MAG: recombination mediator RecR [Flavobacteriales bacterium]|jgi:recombination protein RecR|nr:recombination mediator RecR [Flavobacteriales bacterium]